MTGIRRLLCAALGLLQIVACGSPDSGDLPAERPARVVVHGSIPESELQPILEEYRKQTGMEVLYVSGSAESLIDGIVGKKRVPSADLFIGGSADALWHAAEEGVFRPSRSEALPSAVPAPLRDPEWSWYALGTRATSIYYHPPSVDPSELSSFEALALPDWRGRLCLSSSAVGDNRSLIASLIARHGERSAELTVRGWIANLANGVYPNDRKLLGSIAAGVCAVGIASPDWLPGDGREAGDTLGIFRPSVAAAVHVNIVGGGVTRHAENPEGALKLLEWLATGSGSKLFIEGTGTTPPSAWAALSDSMISVSKLGYLYQDAIDLAVRAHYP